MKKYLAAVAVVALVAFAAPAFAAVNPFVDVPVNHWAYDAIGQLAARGVLSGYPDGTYKGKQPTTRYEMASALARALALVDMSKASKQDVELLKKLVVEFKDELDALGVRVDDIDARLGKIESRLGGWRFTGALRQDIASVANFPNGTRVVDAMNRDHDSGMASLWRARLFVDRWFGEDESMHFFARIEGSDVRYNKGGRGSTGTARTLEFTRFFVEMPVWGDAKLTVGRNVNDALEAPYYLGGKTPFSKHMDFYNDSWMLDRMVDAVRIDKSFGMGSFALQIGHTNNDPGYADAGTNLSWWNVFASGQLQFTEQFGLDLGVQAFLGDNNDRAGVEGSTLEYEFDSMWTGLVGLRFDFNPSIALRGMLYYQANSIDAWDNGVAIDSPVDDSVVAYKVIADVKQDLLKFTSLWLQYSHLEQGFWLPSGGAALFQSYDFAHAAGSGISNLVAPGGVVAEDLNIIGIAAQQEWTDKWSTWLFWNNFNVDSNVYDGKIDHFGLGVNYQYNPNVLFGLSYSWAKLGDSFDNDNDPSEIRFRTQVTF